MRRTASRVAPDAASVAAITAPSTTGALQTTTRLRRVSGNIAIAKFTHSGSQMNDWTPKGTQAEDLNLYEHFIGFVRSAIQDLNDKGHPVELAGIFYHVGENEMAFYPYRKDAPQWLQSIIARSRQDLSSPALKWHVSQQPPPDEKRLNTIDITGSLAAIAADCSARAGVRRRHHS